jgi:hypothetical protein
VSNSLKLESGQESASTSPLSASWLTVTEAVERLGTSALNSRRSAAAERLRRGGIAAGAALGGMAIDAATAGTKDEQVGNVGEGAPNGAAAGAVIGSLVPVIGTAVGAAVGAVAGGLYADGQGNSERATAEEAAKGPKMSPEVERLEKLIATLEQQNRLLSDRLSNRGAPVDVYGTSIRIPEAEMARALRRHVGW